MDYNIKGVSSLSLYVRKDDDSQTLIDSDWQNRQDTDSN